MNTKYKYKYKTNFDDFEISLVKEIKDVYSLFEKRISKIQSEQLKIFRNIERGLLYFDANSFSNQVHFQFAFQTPVQRWFPYREGYSIKLVNSFIKELGIKGNIFDPFSGSGTTLLSARHNGLQSFGVDINPISVLVSNVENEQYTNTDIKKIKSNIERLKKIVKSNEEYHTSFPLADKVFNKEILNSLLYLKNIIQKIQEERVKNLFFVAWLSIIEEVSNIKKEGNGIKYKNRRRTPNGYIRIDKEKWERQNFPGDKYSYVSNKLIDRLEIIISDIQFKYGLNENKPKIYNGSCLQFDELISDEIEFTFFSPPYCNCFDYFEIHKVELWLGDFIYNKEQFKKLRIKGFRSNINSLDNKPVIFKNENLESLISLFDSNKLWNKKIPTVVRGYFDDTYVLLKKLYLHIKKNGFVGIVVGNSAYSGVIIPTDILISDIAREIGFNVKNVFITRHLTTSSQQKQKLEPLKDYLRESIVLLEK
ncbi:MAG: hypothetical protein ISS16_03470 [Ignavibacteria bacterium]|nr:hypothetical protein [Ignavibacteria bacterium]